MEKNREEILGNEIIEDTHDNIDDKENKEIEEINEEEQNTEKDCKNMDIKAHGTKDKKEKKGFFKKNDNEEKIKKLEEEVRELKDKYTRQLAEFENFRKRNEELSNKMYDIGVKDAIGRILPVVDSFDRGMKGVDENTNDAFIKGMLQVYKQMNVTLKDLNVEVIPAVGEKFNPDLHNAVMQVEDESVESDIVVEEVIKGYKYKDIIVRYSMVKVSE